MDGSGSYYTTDRRTMEYRRDILQWDRCSVGGYLMGYIGVSRPKVGSHWVHLLLHYTRDLRRWRRRDMGQSDRMIMEMDEYSRGRGMYDMKLTMGGI